MIEVLRAVANKNKANKNKVNHSNNTGISKVDK